MSPDEGAPESSPASAKIPSVESAKKKVKGRIPTWKELLKKKKFWTIVLFIFLLWYGTSRFEKLILNPPEEDWGPVAVEDLSAERWYESDEGKRISAELGDLTDHPGIRIAHGMFYRVYKRNYSSGVRNTQLIKVGPDQYPDIYRMVTNACEVLGAPDGEPVPVPRVYLGYNSSNRGIIVTNYRDPVLVIGDAFLWVYQPEELEYLIARKVGNIHCKHVFLLDMVKGARGVLNSWLPDFMNRIILGGIGGKLLDWLKEAEISADRAGLLVTGDVDTACNALIKLNIGASLNGYYGHANPEAYAQQIKLVTTNRFATAGAAMAELQNPNPFLTVRVGSLLKFHERNSALFMDREDGATTGEAYDHYSADELGLDELDDWEDEAEAPEGAEGALDAPGAESAEGAMDAPGAESAERAAGVVEDTLDGTAEAVGEEIEEAVGAATDDGDI